MQTAAFIQSWCSDALLGRPSSPVTWKSWSSCNQSNRRSFVSKPQSSRIHQFRMCAQTEEKSAVGESLKDKQIQERPRHVAIEKSVTAAAYVGFVIFAFFLAPGSYDYPGEFQKIFNGNISDVNDLFFAIFNLVGAISITFAAVFNAGASQQKKLSTNLFSFFGFFVGFLGLGPYMIGREYAPQVKREEVEERGFLSRILESRIFGVTVFLYTLWIYGFAFGLFTPGSEELHDAMFYAASVDFGRLFLSDRVVCTTTIDTVILSTLLWGPLTEDMRRRGWFIKGRETESRITALSILSAPGLGPALYLVLRPRLHSGASGSDSQR